MTGSSFPPQDPRFGSVSGQGGFPSINQEARLSALAVTSLVLGIIGCIPLVGVLGLILGIVALVTINGSAGQLKGKGVAIAGIVTSVITTFLMIPMLLVGMLLPALGAARLAARQMQSNTCARGVHSGQVLYAAKHDEKYSDDIAELVRARYFQPEFTLSPTSAKQIPSDYNAWPADRQDDWIRHNASYILIPGLKDDTKVTTVALFLRPDDSNKKGISVAFNDNHVLWMPIEEARPMIEQQTGKTLEELIARQENYVPRGDARPPN